MKTLKALRKEQADKKTVMRASGGFANPDFATHEAEAWAVANVAVQIGPILSRNNPIVDDFNAMIMDIFNLASGNLLQRGNVLTWNVWLDAPMIIDRPSGGRTRRRGDGRSTPGTAAPTDRVRRYATSTAPRSAPSTPPSRRNGT